MSGSITVVEGNVGAGKTTFIKALSEYLNDGTGSVVVYYEPIFPEYLQLYLSNIPKYAFMFQSMMIQARINIFENAMRDVKSGAYVIIDRSIYGDIAFAQMQIKEGYFTAEEEATYNTLVAKSIIKFNEFQNLKTFYLSCMPGTCFQRVKKRGIPEEIKAYTYEYLSKLDEAYDTIMEEYSAKYHNITYYNWDPDVDLNKFMEENFAATKFGREVGATARWLKEMLNEPPSNNLIQSFGLNT